MVLVVAYDVVSDRRRTRLAKALLDYLARVQKSVFEGTIASERYQSLLEAIDREIDPEEDNVRIYQLCVGCRNRVLVKGCGRWVADDLDDAVV